jgi:carbamoyltransferase
VARTDDAGFPAAAAAWCLREGGLAPSELDHVAIERNPRANLHAKLAYTRRRRPSAGYVASRLRNATKVRGVASELARARRRLRRAAGRRPRGRAPRRALRERVLRLPFQDAAVLTVDGFGDFASTMLARGGGTRIEVLDRVLLPHSLGIYQTAITQWLGFPHYRDEGKVMGLAPLRPARAPRRDALHRPPRRRAV